MNRTEILTEAARLVSKDRAAQHGDVERGFATISRFWSAYTSHYISPADVAAMMALLKIARITNSPDHADNWLDLAGYAACGGELALNNEVEL